MSDSRNDLEVDMYFNYSVCFNINNGRKKENPESIVYCPCKKYNKIICKTELPNYLIKQSKSGNRGQKQQDKWTMIKSFNNASAEMLERDFTLAMTLGYFKSWGN